MKFKTNDTALPPTTTDKDGGETPSYQFRFSNAEMAKGPGLFATLVRMFGRPSAYMAACKDLEESRLVLLNAQDKLEFQQAYVRYLEIKIARLERTVLRQVTSFVPSPMGGTNSWVPCGNSNDSSST